MENTFYLEIITPDRQFYTGPATNLTMPALDGEYGVQPGHEPVVTALRPGTVRFHAEGIRHEVVVSDGFAEIMPDYVILLVSRTEVRLIWLPRPGRMPAALLSPTIIPHWNT